ncbi:MAG TPA: toprim domain-containing protein, partial [bacterium]|nr:toprim domain-containing protein [bacterium]
GYAPSGSTLSRRAAEKGIEARLLEKAGLAIFDKERDALIDRFRNRVIFPISDSQGRAAGFGGRVIGDGMPKYLNSPDSDFFHKSELLYNFHRARESALKEGAFVVAEGYMDVIGLWEAGFRNSVATMGTAFTPAQVQLLARYVEKIILMFDSDFAGQEAVIRSLNLLLEKDLRVFVVVNPYGKDPDEVFREKGKEALESIIRDARPLMVWRLEELTKEKDLSSIDIKMEVIHRMFPLLRSIPSPVRHKDEMKRLAEKLKTEEYILWEEYKRFMGEQKFRLRKPEKAQASPARILRGKEKLEQEILAYLLRNQEEVPAFAEKISPEELEGKYHVLILGQIYEFSRKNKKCDEASMLSSLPDLEAQEYLAQVLWEKEKKQATREELLENWERHKAKLVCEDKKKKIKEFSGKAVPRELLEQFQGLAGKYKK